METFRVLARKVLDTVAGEVPKATGGLSHLPGVRAVPTQQHVRGAILEQVIGCKKKPGCEWLGWPSSGCPPHTGFCKRHHYCSVSLATVLSLTYTQPGLGDPGYFSNSSIIFTAVPLPVSHTLLKTQEALGRAQLSLCPYR